MMHRTLAPALACGLLLLAASRSAGAEQAPFDLVGPSIQVSATRAGVTLPIAQVPQLSAGDIVTIRADLPADQSARYILVGAFLRGTTNPPPDKWFFQSETWAKKGRDGLKLTVPEGAQQLVYFLAPETGGDFPTLRNAVRGQPGAFVRAAQDLNQASLDRSRLDAYLKAVRVRDPADPDRLERITPLLARSLAVKVNTDCLQKMPELQSACLMQNQEALVLNDGHSNAITDALAGPGSDLALQLAATPQGGLGYYSPYIAAIRDIIGILSSFHTAKYQYIPGLATLDGDKQSLVLNTPPSFHNPKSVLVAALPTVGTDRPPPLQAAAPTAQLCAQASRLTLPVSGAPLVYSTDYAHAMRFAVRTAGGRTIELPATADAEQGGYVVATDQLKPADRDGAVSGTLHGVWGFTPFTGPTFHLQAAQAGQWKLADAPTLIAGRDATVSLSGGSTACVASVAVKGPDGATRPVVWKPADTGGISAVLPGGVGAGALTLLVQQRGQDKPDAIALTSYAQPTQVERFDVHAGDGFGTLGGGLLDQVVTVTVDNAVFRPAADTLARQGQSDTLRLDVADPAATKGWAAGQAKTAKVAFRDGRTATTRLTVGAPRFAVTLIGKHVQVAPSVAPVSIQLTSDEEVPRNSILTFSLRAAGDAAFNGRETVEVATASNSGSTVLSAASGLTLEDPHVALATVDGAKAFGLSAYGPLRFRVMRDGVAGDWQPLGTMVRLPSLRQLDCPGTDGPCQLSGDGLFLIQSVSATADFAKPAEVPQGYPANALTVPRPAGGQLFVKLRDDPAVVNQIANSGGAH